MSVIDLSHVFQIPMPVYPGDPAPELKTITTVTKEGFMHARLTTTMHVGTHVDAPAHMIANGKYMSDFPPECFMGRGVLIDAAGSTSLDVNLLRNVHIQEGDIVLFLTDWSKNYGTPAYFENFPHLTEACAQELIARGVKMIGLDSPSPDWEPFLIHKLLLAHEILIIENLTNLRQLSAVGEFEVIALPLRLRADGALARVVARTMSS